MSANTAAPDQSISRQSDSELQAELLGITATAKPPSASRIGTPLNRVFVVVVLIAIPLAYYFGYIGVTWLNRIGIILNFCAGFMLAPELLGVQRLNKAELLVEEFLSTIANGVHRMNKSIMNMLQSLLDDAINIVRRMGIKNTRYAKVTFVLIALFISFKILYDAYFDTKTIIYFSLAILLGGWLALAVGGVKQFFHGKRTSLSIKSFVIINIVLAPIIAFLLAIFVALAPLILVIITIIGRFFSYTTQSLAGDNRLRSILVWWGIIFFIVGNLLQFLSTF